MAWLETAVSGTLRKYAKRIKLTIDGSKIEEDLTDFPVLIHLNDESGILNTDVTDVFDGLYTGAEIGEEEILVLNMDDVGLTDSSLVPKTVTKYGNVTRTSDKSKFGGYSAYFDGTGDYLTVPDSVIQALEDTPSTIDCWVYFYSLSGGTAYYGNPVFSRSYIGGAGAQVFYVKSDGGVAFYRGSEIYGGTFGFSTAAGAIKISTWHHVALTVDGAYWRIFVDGVKVAEAANSTFWTNKYVSGSTMSSSGVHVGRVYQSNYSSYAGYYKGFMDTLSISKSCKWTSDFTPPNQAYYATINDAKKLAITSSDGETQQYVEIESWDADNKEAWLWTKCPTLASGVNADLYLYYDKEAADNDTYVGETGSTAASNVWDDNFVGVWHMSQSPSGDAANAIKDSTTNANHLTPVGSMTDADLVDASPGKGIEFDGSNDRTDKSSAAALPSSTLTYELVAMAEPVAAAPSTGMAIVDSSSDANFISLQAYNGHVRSVQDGILIFSGTTLLTEGDTFYAAFTRLADDERYIFTNGGNKTGNTVSMAYPSSTDRISVGGAGDLTPSYFPGVITEVRISDVVRPDAWIKSTYYSNWDDLVYFYSPAIAPTYVFEGVVSYNEATLSGVQVRLYRRSTGELIDSSSTSASGTFYLSTPFDSEDHYVIALQDYSSINAIIADWVNSSNE